jgi:hypothetical protein
MITVYLQKINATGDVTSIPAIEKKFLFTCREIAIPE